MRARCHNPKSNDYALYGARGIAVCERWRDSFENFLADMGHKPTARHSIDRINNDGNYEPSNCRWATATEQSRNRRCVRSIVIDGVSMCVSAWAEVASVRACTIRSRLNAGWTPKDAVFTPVDVTAGRFPKRAP